MEIKQTKTYILKNKLKFKNIKLALGISLKEVKLKPRKYYKKHSGVSIVKYGQNWFMLPGGRAIFKTFDSDYQRQTCYEVFQTTWFLLFLF